jgi:hypothetical protein
MKLRILSAALAAMLFGSMALAADEPPTPSRALVEIYRIEAGHHEAFLRFISQADEANRLAGLPPRQLYVHQDGASWDFMLIQPASTPPEKSEALQKAWKDLGLPSGPRFFIDFRAHVAEHSDTFAEGPTTAAAWLAKLDKK